MSSLLIYVGVLTPVEVRLPSLFDEDEDPGFETSRRYNTAIFEAQNFRIYCKSADECASIRSIFKLKSDHLDSTRLHIFSL